MRRTTGLLFVLSILLLNLMSSAQQTPSASVPNLIRYGGALKDSAGTAITGTAGVTFAIYKQQEGGAPVWMETQNVVPDASGNYSVLLGSTTASGLPSDLFSQQEQRWLGVQVQGQAEQPRVLLVSVPYAFKAHEAETLGGRSVSDFVLVNGANSASGNNASQTSPSTASNPPAASPAASKGAASQGPTNFSGSTTDQIVKVTQSGTGEGVRATGVTRGIVGTATGTGSGTTFGLYGWAQGDSGIGVYGAASATTGYTIGVKGASVSPAGTGVRGIETATTGDTIGISSYVASPSGIAALFDNAAGGKILSGRDHNVEKFSVDGSGNVSSAGTFRGNGSGLTGLQFSQIGGHLSSSQFSGSYSHAVTLSNTANVFYGDGSHLTGTGGGGCSAYLIQNGTSQPPSQAKLDMTGTGIANGLTSRTIYRPGDSVRFKEQVRDMGDSTSALLKLRPVTSLNKPEYDKGIRTLQYGLIAEEVAKVYPELVANDNEGQPYTVRYQYLAPMLLNEVQKQYQRAEAEAKVIATQQDEINAQNRQIEDLQRRLSRLETLVAAQVKIAGAASPSAGKQ